MHKKKPPLVLLLVALTCANANNITDNGFTANVQSECIDLKKQFANANLPSWLLDQLDTACFTLVLDSCKQQLRVNVSYGNNILLDQNLDARDNNVEQCGAKSGVLECQTCVGLDNVTISTSRAHVCPYVKETCIGISSPEVNSQCFELGQDCSQLDCHECVAATGCGWCGGQNLCQAATFDSSAPYCDTCSGDWSTASAACPLSPNAANSGGGLTTAEGITVGILVPVALLGLFTVGYLVYRRRAHVGYSRAVDHTEPLNEDDDATSTGMVVMNTDISTASISEDTALEAVEDVYAKDYEREASQLSSASSHASHVSNPASVTSTGSSRPDKDPAAARP